MRNLLNFFIRYHVLFLFLFLELVSLTYIVKYNSFQRVKVLNSSNIVAGEILEEYNSVLDYFSLKKINLALAKENANLREQLQPYLLSHISDTVKTDISREQIRSVSAKVINNSVNKQYNYITLNKGASDSIKPDMGVICPNGVVGVIINVSEHYSTALSVLNGRWSLNAKLKNTNYFGPLHWDGENSEVTSLDEIPYHVYVKEGDEVVTSGYSATFPEGILIGKVLKVYHKEGDSFKKINVELSTDFKSLYYVEVVEKITKQEQLELENDTEDE